jgi:hypothetical protein
LQVPKSVNVQNMPLLNGEKNRIRPTIVFLPFNPVNDQSGANALTL